MKQILLVTTALLFFVQFSQDEKQLKDISEKAQTKRSHLPTIGKKIKGDFDGDGRIDIATAIKTKNGSGNPVEDGKSDEYRVQFSHGRLKTILTNCCSIRLINEGDLNGDGADDLSIYQAPMNGCTYTMTTYSFIGGNWRKIIKPFIIPTSCQEISDQKLQKRVFKENGLIYYYETDPNNESGKLIKRIANNKG